MLQHAPHEGPGSIAGVLGESGIEVAVTRLDLREPLPVADAIGGLVVLGGPMGVHDSGAHPWLAPERTLLHEAVQLDLPVLGVCLGAQQLAAALGAEVTAGQDEEVGVGQVELTQLGRRDPVFGPEYHGLSGTTVPCVHWHRDTFTLPHGAVHLAATGGYPQQAFRIGTRAYGLQFHIEVDAQLAEGWRPLLPAGVTLPGPDIARIGSVGRRLLGRFVDVAVASSGGVRV